MRTGEDGIIVAAHYVIALLFTVLATAPLHQQRVY